MIKTYSLQRDRNYPVTLNFKVGEFARWDNKAACAKYCGDSIMIDSDLVVILQKIREHFKSAVIITSGYRPKGYNTAIGGASDSYHIKGQAADFYVHSVSPSEVAKYAESIGARGVGLYTAQRFVHVDTRSTKYFWRNDGGANYTVGSHGGNSWVKLLQTAVGVSADGIFGVKTSKACPMLREGSKSAVVKLLQERLGVTADGMFGAKTLSALKSFQKQKGIAADGIVGKNTWSKLAQ